MARIKVTRGSGNVFADLGLPHPEERLAKAALAHELARLIRSRGVTQKATADLLEIDQPKVSHLLHGRHAGFSTELTRVWPARQRHSRHHRSSGTVRADPVSSKP